MEETPAFEGVVKKEKFDVGHAGLVLVLLLAGISAFVADLLGMGADGPRLLGMSLPFVAFLIFTAAAAITVVMPMFLRHPREIAMVMGLTAAGSLSFYAYTTYMQKYLVNSAGFTKNEATEITAGALIAFMLAQPFMGWVSDIIGRKKMLISAFGIGALMAYPIFTGIAAVGDPMAAWGLLFTALLVQSAYTSISAVIKAELFPTHVRALGVALPYALANAACGGTAEFAALWFKNEGFEQGFFFYVSVMCAIAFLVSCFMRDTKLKSAILED
jgi:MHS family alpha-ketoglutarate permease-like MFS transporter